MALPTTRIDLSHEELERLSTEEKRTRVRELNNLMQVNTIPGAGGSAHGTSSHGFTSTSSNTSSSNLRASYGGYGGRGGRGGRRGRGSYSSAHSYGSHGRYHPYPQRPSYLNRTATFTQTGPLVMEQDPQTITTLCRAFTSTGICARTGCRYVHDLDKVAICPSFLYKNNCSDGGDCALSHLPTLHNTEACYHFQKGCCTKEDCRFPHVHVSPSALVCEDFSRLGYCEKGSTCADRHTWTECPDFANKAACEAGYDCPLKHVRHAGRLRNIRLSTEAESPLSPSSPENSTMDDQTPSMFANESNAAESDTPDIAINGQSDISESGLPGIIDFMPATHIDNQQGSTHGLSQQEDFVRFE